MTVNCYIRRCCHDFFFCSPVELFSRYNPFCDNFCAFLLQTVDVFAIVALSGIVSRLLSTGTVLVATSNRAPEDLNQVRNFSWKGCIIQ